MGAYAFFVTIRFVSQNRFLDLCASPSVSTAPLKSHIEITALAHFDQRYNSTICISQQVGI